MHILYIHQYFATHRGRTGTRSYEFARRWVAAGHRVTMLTSVAQLTDEDLGGPPAGLITRLEIEEIQVIALNVRYRQAMGFARRIWAFFGFVVLASWMTLRIRDVDMVYATSTPLTVGIPALVGWWVQRKPYIFEVRDVWPDVPIGMGVIRNPVLIRLLFWLERTIYRNARAVVPLSPGMEASVRERVSPGKRVVTIPNCADTDLFDPHVDGEGVRRQRGWDGRFVCLHAGAMGPVNGLDVVVHAASRFRDDPEFLFVLVGEGGEKPRLRAVREELGLENLQIIDGMAKRDMPELVAAADVCLVLSANVRVLADNSANKLFDYLAAGKPVVINYAGWQREVLESTQAGLGCEMGDEEAFFENLAILKADASRRAAMGRNARQLAVEEYDRDKLAARALNVIVEACGR